MKFIKKANGLTLLEMCIAMMIMSILSIGVASMVRGGVESQLNDRLYSTMHLVASNIAGDIRYDLARSYGAQVSGDGMQLTIATEDGTNILYQVYVDASPSANSVLSLRRVAGGTTKIYNRPASGSEYRPSIRVSCDVTIPGSTAIACFQGMEMLGGNTSPTANNAAPTQIYLPEFSIYSPDYVTSNDRSYLNSFGPPRYRLQQTSFDVLSNIQFN